MTTDKKERKCLKCGRSLEGQRIDAKFCGISCRSAYSKMKKRLNLQEMKSEEAATELEILKQVQERTNKLEVEIRKRYQERFENQVKDLKEKLWWFKLGFYVVLGGLTLSLLLPLFL